MKLKKINALISVILLLVSSDTSIGRECRTLDTSYSPQCLTNIENPDCKYQTETVCLVFDSVQCVNDKTTATITNGNMNFRCMDDDNEKSKCLDNSSQDCYKRQDYKCESVVEFTCGVSAGIGYKCINVSCDFSWDVFTCKYIKSGSAFNEGERTYVTIE